MRNVQEDHVISMIEGNNKETMKVEVVTTVTGRRIISTKKVEQQPLVLKHIDIKACLSFARRLDASRETPTVEKVLMIRTARELEQYRDDELEILRNKLKDLYARENRAGEYYSVSNRGAYLSVTTLYR